MFEQWGFLIALGTAGFVFISPIVTGFAAKLFPTASANTTKWVTAASQALGVILAIWLGEKFFGKRVKEI